jgi:hypothetical protein
MRKLVRILTTVKTMGVVDVKHHVVKHVVDVVRTVKHLALCALFLSQAILRASILAARSAAAGCYAWALVPACQGRWQRPESRWGWSRPPQS